MPHHHEPAPRALWTGSLSFGLVNIPVRLYSAARERALTFKLLAKEDLCPISYKKVCRNDDRPVAQEDIVKGYEVEKGRFVVLEPEDFKKANARRTELIEIVQFVDLKEIDAKLYDKPYYIEPLKRSAKAYVLLRDALAKSGKVAIATFVMREKEHVAAIRADGSTLILDQLRFLDEIRDASEIHVPDKADYTKKEFDLALSLVESLSGHFKPDDFKDTYTDELLRVIRAKAKGKLKELKEVAEPVKETEVEDILEQLKKSLSREPAHAR